MQGLMTWRHRTARPATASPDERRFLAGLRSVADLVAPAAVEVRRDHLCLERQYARVLAVTGYPRTVAPGWLQPLLDLGEPVELSLHVTPLESGPVVRLLSHQLVQLESSRRLALGQGRLLDPERETACEDVERLRAALQRGDERVFSVTLSLLLRAPSLAALDALTQRVEATLDGMLAQSRAALLEQEQGFRSCLPMGRDELGRARNLDTASVATMFPFTSAGLTMPDGVLYGVTVGGQTPVLLDPFDGAFENANMVIFAKSGAGKSFCTKLLALRLLVQGVDVLVVDPEDEYRALCQAAGGQVVRLASASAQHFNPFDLPPADEGDEGGADPLGEQVVALLALLDVMLAEPGGRLAVEVRALLEQALYETYARAGITRDPASHGRPAPRLRDLYATLLDGTAPPLAAVAPRLRRYVEGALAGLFAGPTNVRLDGRCTVFDLRALAPELRAVGIHLITSFVWGQVRRRRRPRLLIVDEAWSLLQYPEGGAFLASMARRARKYYLGLWTITQDVGDFLGCEQGRAVLTNAAVKLLMKQDSSTIAPVAQAFQLSPTERQWLLGAGKGQGLLYALGSKLALQVEASAAEHRLATTAPRDLADSGAAPTTPAAAVPPAREATHPSLDQATTWRVGPLDEARRNGHATPAARERHERGDA